MDNFKGIPHTKDSLNKLTNKEKEFLNPFEDLLSIAHRMIRAVVDYSDSHADNKVLDRTDVSPMGILYFIDELKKELTMLWKKKCTNLGHSLLISQMWSLKGVNNTIP